MGHVRHLMGLDVCIVAMAQASVSVAGFGDIPFVRFSTPTLTTVDMQSGAIERTGAGEADRMLDASEEMLKPRLVLPQSTSAEGRTRGY
ncbi:MAG: hypothetical protein ACT6S0_05675 [Roseateles sp.]|uniref:hypothetical protein n=1 Tax=Roseateles sp. TaxID=1971397 RepID=UPI0040355638